MQKTVKAIIQKELKPELKYAHLTSVYVTGPPTLIPKAGGVYNNTAISLTQQNLVPVVPQNDTRSGRNGNQILLKEVDISFSLLQNINNPRNQTTVRVMIVEYPDYGGDSNNIPNAAGACFGNATVDDEVIFGQYRRANMPLIGGSAFPNAFKVHFDKKYHFAYNPIATELDPPVNYTAINKYESPNVYYETIRLKPELHITYVNSTGVGPFRCQRGRGPIGIFFFCNGETAIEPYVTSLQFDWHWTDV